MNNRYTIDLIEHYKIAWSYHCASIQLSWAAKLLFVLILLFLLFFFLFFKYGSSKLMRSISDHDWSTAGAGEGNRVGNVVIEFKTN